MYNVRSYWFEWVESRMSATMKRESSPGRGRTARPWWRRPWMAPLFLGITGFLAYSVPPYLTLDPSLTDLEGPEGSAIFYPLLVIHVLTGTVAMVTCCFQIWPWFRKRYRRGHRITGWVYVLVGVLPAGVTAVYIGLYTPFGPATMVGNILIALLWLFVTMRGFQAARGRRLDEHRRWMIRSFVLTMSIIVSRIFAVPAIISLAPHVDSIYAGSEELMLQSATSINVWLSLAFSLVISQWWLERGGRPRRVSGARAADRGVTPSTTLPSDRA